MPRPKTMAETKVPRMANAKMVPRFSKKPFLLRVNPALKTIGGSRA